MLHSINGDIQSISEYISQLQLIGWMKRHTRLLNGPLFQMCGLIFCVEHFNAINHWIGRNSTQSAFIPIMFLGCSINTSMCTVCTCFHTKICLWLLNFCPNVSFYWLNSNTVSRIDSVRILISFFSPKIYVLVT